MKQLVYRQDHVLLTCSFDLEENRDELRVRTEPSDVTACFSFFFSYPVANHPCPLLRALPPDPSACLVGRIDPFGPPTAPRRTGGRPIVVTLGHPVDDEASIAKSQSLPEHRVMKERRVDGLRYRQPVVAVVPTPRLDERRPFLELRQARRAVRLQSEKRRERVDGREGESRWRRRARHVPVERESCAVSISRLYVLWYIPTMYGLRSITRLSQVATRILHISAPTLRRPVMSPPPLKRQKREEYRRAQADAQADAQSLDQCENAASGVVKLPKKRFYRQRAHANPFSDHRLD